MPRAEPPHAPDARMRMRQDANDRTILATLTAGAVIGVVEVVIASSFAALI